MVAHRVTVAIVPSERFSQANASLLSILEHTDPAHELIYIDGGSPPLVRQFLEQRAMRHGFRLISTERYVSPNVARNIALSRVRTRYVALVDNDVLVSPGWLERLVECAEATGAAIVGPLVCQGEPTATVVRTAGGTAQIVRDGHRMWLKHGCRFHGRTVAELDGRLAREPVDQVPFHAVLLRTSMLAAVGLMDEQLLSAGEHLDYCLRARIHGLPVFLEPSSVVTYVPPPPFEATDLDYFQLRWCDAWNRASLERFASKWNLPADDPELRKIGQRLESHRRRLLQPYRRMLNLLGTRTAQWFEEVCISPWERALSRKRYPLTNSAYEVGRRAA
jgi:GT2 family glycosyltransferase